MDRVGSGEVYIIHAQLGLIQVMRVGLKTGEALGFWAATAVRAILEK